MGPGAGGFDGGRSAVAATLAELALTPAEAAAAAARPWRGNEVQGLQEGQELEGFEGVQWAQKVLEAGTHQQRGWATYHVVLTMYLPAAWAS